MGNQALAELWVSGASRQQVQGGVGVGAIGLRGVCSSWGAKMSSRAATEGSNLRLINAPQAAALRPAPPWP